MSIMSFPPPPVFVASILEFKNDSSKKLYGYYHECMGTIATGLHVLTICSCVTTFDPQDRVFVLKWPSHFIVVAGTNSLSSFVAQRKVTNIFAHRFCGGRPRVVDLGLVKVDHPWDPTPEFGVAPFGIDPEKSYYDYWIKTKPNYLSVYDCSVYTWINRVSIEEDWKPYDNDTVLDGKMTNVQPIDECYPYEMHIGNITIPVNKTTRDDQFCAKMSIGRGCGIDKGAPLICQKPNQNDGEIFLVGVGLGGAKCDGVKSLSLYQGFKNSLSFLRYYLSLDDGFQNDKLLIEERASYADDEFIFY